MNKMIDPRYCQNFRNEKVCPNWDQEIMDYLDNRVITPMSLTFEPEAFDKAFEYCASCPQFIPFDQAQEVSRSIH